MLYLNRRPGEAVIINHDIEVRVIEVRGKTVKLGFSFPADASVLREEVFAAIREANVAAAATADVPPGSIAPPARAGDDNEGSGG